jgi:hypothetical protein
MRYEKVWDFKTANFRVALECMPDNDCDLSWDDTGETQANIASGLWGCFVFKVAVYDLNTGNEIGADYLGGSIYPNPSDFIDHRQCGKQNREYEAQGKPGRCGSYFHDMIKGAISEARKAYSKPRVRLRAI